MERKLKILIADSQPDEILINALKEKENKVIYLGCLHDYEEIINCIENNSPDIIILELVLGNRDGFGLIDYINNHLKNSHRPKIVVLTELEQKSIIIRTLEMGVDFYLKKPIRQKDIENLLTSYSIERVHIKQQDYGFVKTVSVDETLTKLFVSAGIPAHIKGYQFLREAIKLAIKEPNVINCITKRLYPTIATMYETTPSKVERAIRHAIEVAWNRGKVESLNTMFGVKVYSNNDKPTNGEFIALIADKMLIDGMG